MGNTGIDHAKKLILRFLLVKHDAAGNVSDLYDFFTF